ncbi:VOC family protein [Natronoarchaeum sp. GCM10025703]|uniref:VOC family protein n=1 Tax=Natronoarchaeum sp. GCM10025703 TaxID=3252685 RepID=UPI0036129E91
MVHLAVRVEDVEATVEALVAATDCPVTNGPLTIEAAGARAAFVEDPDGYEVEIFSPLE